MAFFKKLKDRLFKSSSKIEDGLDAIVEDGGIEEEVAVAEPQVDTQAAEAARLADIAVEQQRQAAADQAAVDARDEDAKRQAEADAHAQLAQAARERDEAAAAQAAEAAQLAREAAALAQSEARADAEAKQHEAERVAQDAREKAQAAIEGEEARRAEELVRMAATEEAADATRQAEAARDAAAQEARRVEDARLEAERTAQETAAKPGLLGRLLGRGEAQTVVRRELDDAMLEQLEELLISADMGVDTALRVTANMAEGRYGKRLSTQEIKELLAAEVTRIMEPVARPMPLYPTKPQVVLVVGVNGSGKTTTIGKLASQFQAAGKKVVIAAGDTFRAAAVEQLQVWGDRAGVPVLTAPEGSDPASLAFEAMEQAARDGADLLMIDTAGRLQNRADLMEELSKIVRVIRKKDPDAPHNTLLVLDATTGQNALSQVKTFQELADVSGLVMTKLDGTAKGGVLVALADKFGLPIHAIGVGEQIDDLAPFDPEDFAAALIGLDR